MNWIKKIEELRVLANDTLTSVSEPAVAEIRAITEKNYTPKHTSDEYFNFIKDTSCHFSVEKSRSGYPFNLIDKKGRWIYRDSFEQALDEAMR